MCLQLVEELARLILGAERLVLDAALVDVQSAIKVLIITVIERASTAKPADVYTICGTEPLIDHKFATREYRVLRDGR